MAQAKPGLLVRQLSSNPINRPYDQVSGPSKWVIIGIVIAVIIAIAVSTTTFLLYLRARRRRRQPTNPVIPLNTTTAIPNKLTSPAANNSSRYGAGPTGYGATPDQNHALLGNAEAPAIVMWDVDQPASTQDGFGYDNNLHLAGSVQRPASIASFSGPPPRYEETASQSTPGLRPQTQGEAASYFNAAQSQGEDRGRSPSREPSSGTTRGRALSGNRSINGDRRRSISRFREEGMVDVSMGVRDS